MKKGEQVIRLFAIFMLSVCCLVFIIMTIEGLRNGDTGAVITSLILELVFIGLTALLIKKFSDAKKQNKKSETAEINFADRTENNNSYEAKVNIQTYTIKSENNNPAINSPSVSSQQSNDNTVQKEAESDNTQANDSVINDTSYVKTINHVSNPGGWQQYDVLLDCRPYGWDYMVDVADYLDHSDFHQIQDVWKAAIASMPETSITNEYVQSGRNIKAMESLKNEMGSLSIAGGSKALKDAVKIVWYNQTNQMRLFTIGDNVDLIDRYVESIIRRNFGTPDEMKPAKKN